MDTVVNRENLSSGVPGGVATSATLATPGTSQVPLIIRRCVEEIERRGLDIIGENILLASETPYSTGSSLPWAADFPLGFSV